MMIGLRLTEDQFNWIIEHMEVRWQDKTVGMFRQHYVEGVSRADVAREYSVDRSFISQRFGRFESSLSDVLSDMGICVTSVFHTETNTSKIRQLDITSTKRD
ncbi:MAG: hypothetical protein GY814_00630 [Gammaproteobacteria bacterium]|nr:hypothetical protein [Gammaproteobacteria bacterium]